MPNYIKLGNLRIEIPEPANNGGGGGGGGGGSSSLLTGLLAFYNLSDLTDASGNGNTLTNRNGVTFGSGGTPGSYAIIGANNGLESNVSLPDSDWSIHLWYSINPSNHSAYCTPVATSSISATLTHRPDNQVYIWIGNGEASHITDPETEWISAVMGRQNNNPFLSLNGIAKVVDTTKTLGYGPNVSINPSSIPGNATFDGKVGAWGIWSRALTDAEIAELYNAGAGKEHPFA